MAEKEKYAVKKSTVENREITTELKEAYLDYAMSVIVSRALPDVRDGLKPVQRRILWAMWESGVTHSAKFRKSANVVGEVLGKYHPHGDMAVYDTMVRMTQDFSLRYPLIDGQGNFGCFTKDTKIKLTDGRNLSFEDLIKESVAGKKNYTYTVNSAGLISVAEIKNPRLTRKNAELIRIALDNGQEIKCTPNHRFMLKNGSYKQAKDLESTDSLMPLYEKLSSKQDRLNREGYVLIYQNKKDDWVPAHHLADNYNLTAKHYRKNAGRVRHHVDFNKLNNNPDNIARIGWGEHWKIHYQHASQQHRDPKYRQKIAEGRTAFWANPDNRARSAKNLSDRNKLNWQKPEYRAKMRRFLSEINKEYFKKHPELSEIRSKRASRTLKRMWQNPEYRSLFHEKIVAANKKRITNNTGKLKFLKICREVLNNRLLLNKKNYELLRNKVYEYGLATTWGIGIKKYFENKPDLVLHELNKNHKVVKVETLGEKADVYDLTIDKSHNFVLAAGVFVHNSIDGDSAAAHRYTEARMSAVAEELLTDIEKETVDWQPNYDGTKQEPKVMPARLPNLLLNGAVGIAVGMATNIPPHNLGELVDAITYLIDNPKSASSDLTNFIQGPDFPTGGIIYDKRAIAETYATGKGAITMRAKAEIKDKGKGQYYIEVTEIPYQVNKSELLIKMAELITDKKIVGVRDVRDESDRKGISIIIELKSDATPQKILNQLFQYTDLQKDFHVNVIALQAVKGATPTGGQGLQPQLMSLKDVLAAYIEHRKEVITRRAQYDLRKAEERAHILMGLAKALSIIDKIISAIKKSQDREDAHKNLVKNFKFTDVQATAILEMKLQTLANLERQKIEDELKEKKKLIAELQLLLKSPAKILKIIKDELAEIKKKYGDERRTKVIAGALGEFKEEDLVPKEEAVICMSRGGYIKRLPPTTFRSQGRGGKGLIGSEVGEEDLISHFIGANTHDNILFFTDRGRVFQTKVYEIPQGTRTAKGKPIHNFLQIPLEEKATAIIAYPDSLKVGGNLIMVTKNGLVKKTKLEDFKNVRRNGIIAIKIKKGDLLKAVELSKTGDEVIITSANGQAIRFKESQARAMGRAASGVRGIRLKKNDTVAEMDLIDGAKTKDKNIKLLVVMANGYGKQTPLSQYRLQSRGGSGIKTAKITSKTGELIAAHVIDEEKELLALSNKGQIIKTELASVRTASRATQGVRIMTLKPGDKLTGVICL